MFVKFIFVISFFFSTVVFSQTELETDLIRTSDGELQITHLGHASLIFGYLGKIIYVDPFGRVADYSTLPKADMIFITHAHQDYLDPSAIGQIKKDDTIVLCPPPSCSPQLGNSPILINPGQSVTLNGLEVRAVHAYNILHKRPNGDPYHIKGEGVGYVITFGDKKVYVAGDTEFIPEMAELEKIDIAFLPANLPATMTASMVAEAAKTIKPVILYPYHYGSTDLNEIKELFEDEEIQFRVRGKGLR